MAERIERARYTTSQHINLRPGYHLLKLGVDGYAITLRVLEDETLQLQQTKLLIYDSKVSHHPKLFTGYKFIGSLPNYQAGTIMQSNVRELFLYVEDDNIAPIPIQLINELEKLNHRITVIEKKLVVAPASPLSPYSPFQ